MLNLCCEEQQQACASKPVQTLDKLTADLGMDELVEPTVLVDIQNTVRETSGDLTRKVNPESDGEKLYAYDAMRILQEVSYTWARLYEVVVIY